MTFEDKLEGQKIILERPKTTFEQAKEIFDLTEVSRAELRPWLSWCDKTLRPEDTFSQYLKDWCESHWEKGEGYAYLIREKDSGAFCGTIDLFKISDEHKSGEIGYWLGTPYVGKGYMHEAVLLLEKHAFAKGLRRIVIQNATVNKRSANVAQRAGYHLDGVLRQDKWSEYHQKFFDSNVWSKLKSD